MARTLEVFVTEIEVVDDFEADFANLARLEAAGSIEDMLLYLTKLVRKYRAGRPQFS